MANVCLSLPRAHLISPGRLTSEVRPKISTWIHLLLIMLFRNCVLHICQTNFLGFARTTPVAPEFFFFLDSGWACNCPPVPGRESAYLLLCSSTWLKPTSRGGCPLSKVFRVPPQRFNVWTLLPFGGVLPPLLFFCPAPGNRGFGQDVAECLDYKDSHSEFLARQ